MKLEDEGTVYAANSQKSCRECLTAVPRSICQTVVRGHFDSRHTCRYKRTTTRWCCQTSGKCARRMQCKSQRQSEDRADKQDVEVSGVCNGKLHSHRASRLLLHGPSLPIRNSYQDPAAGIDTSQDSAYHKTSTTAPSEDDHSNISCWRLPLGCLEAGDRQYCTPQARCRPGSRWALRLSLATQARARIHTNINTKLTPPRRLSPTSTQSGRLTALTTPPTPTQQRHALTAATAATIISSWRLRSQQTSITHSLSQQQS